MVTESHQSPCLRISPPCKADSLSLPHTSLSCVSRAAVVCREDPRAFEAEINEIELVPPSESARRPLRQAHALDETHATSQKGCAFMLHRPAPHALMS
eukprot:1619050-Pleurochrysis_carterae.AAC.1